MPDNQSPTTPREIQRLDKGDKTRTARHASVMNEIIDRVNALTNLRVQPGKDENGKFLLSDSNAILQTPLGIPTPPSSGTYVLGAINGAVQWIATEQCRCDNAVIDGGSP